MVSNYREDLKKIEKVKSRLKENKTVQELFKEYGVDISEIDFIPVCFKKLDVSARTDHGIIYLNSDMNHDDLMNEDHYLVHEMTHFLQQTTGDGPTKGSTDDTYLDNEFEQEGFQAQTKYLSETRSDDAAEKYIDKVLDHHDIPKDERKEKRNELLELAARRIVSTIRKYAAPADETWSEQEGKTFYGRRGAGLLFVCLEDNTALLLQRSEKVDEPGTWGIAGGAIGTEETAQEGAVREATEELGSLPRTDYLIDKVEFTQGNFKYDSLIYAVSLEEKKKWTPTIQLNWENTKAKWFPFDALPSNLHFGVKTIQTSMKEKGIDVFDEPKDEFDWIRMAFRKMFFVGRVSKELVDQIYASSSEEEIKSALDLASKWFVSNKDMDGLRQVNKMKKMLTRAGGLTDWDKPKHEKSKYEQYLYHGTNARDAYSILKNNTFIKGTAFDRVSFTSDLSAAYKFGDVVFVFDGKKVQREGAKKMKYYSDKEMSRLMVGDYKSHNEDAKNPKILDIYSNEKEWSIPLPWKFSDDMLDHLIIGVNKHSGENKAERIKQVLETVTEKPIRVQSTLSYGYQPDQSDTDKLGLGDVKFTVFNEIAKPFNEFFNLSRVYLAKKRVKLKEKYPSDDEAMITSMLKRTTLYPEINFLFQRFDDLKASIQNISKFDASRIQSLKKEINSKINYFEQEAGENEIVSKLVPILYQIMEGVDKTIESMSQHYLNKDEDYENMMTSYRHMYDGPFIDRFIAWVENNPKKLEEFVTSNNLNDKEYNNPSAEAIRSYLESIVNPSAISDEVWRRFPFRLFDNKNAYKLSDEKLGSIFRNNPYLTDFDGSPGKWITKYRKSYTGPGTPAENYWNRLIKILEPGFTIEESNNMEE